LLGIHRAAELKEAAQKIEKLHHASVPDLSLLTARERRVLAETVRGAAQILGISRRTIEFHRANIREKIGAKTTLDLLRAVLAAVDLS
jgi:FixJ family two-component response regulator